MKRSILALSLLGASFSTVADFAFHPSGSNLTYGAVGNHQSLTAYTNNPAVGSSALDTDDWYFGMGLLTSIGIGAEVGPVNNFVDQVDSLQKQLKDFNDSETQSIDAITQIKNDFDSFLIEAGESGRAQVNAAIQAPLFPIVWSSRETLGGSLVLDANAAALSELRILDRPIEYNPLGEGSGILQTNTAVYLKTGMVGEFSLGYSRPVLEMDEGVLHAGVRGALYQVGLNKILVGLLQMEDGADDILKKELEDAQDTTLQTGFGVDLGVLWTARNYRLGAWLKNANSPSFEYDTMGGNCESIATGTDQDSCHIARSFADELALGETYTMDAQVTLEASVYSTSRDFVASFSADSSPVNDPVGNEIQWVTASAGYATTSWIIPGVRVGYRKNLAGSQLSAVSGGITLFNVMHLDALYGLEKVEIDGTSTPRMFQANLGFSLLF